MDGYPLRQSFGSGRLHRTPPPARGALRHTIPRPMTRPPEAPDSHSSAGGSPPRVLLIDDEDAIRGALRRFLTRRGWEVHEAGDGEEGLRLLETEGPARYAAVLCDLRLPGLSGVDLFRRVRDTAPHFLPRLVFSTGDTSSAGAREILADARCPVLEKPFDLAALAGLLDRLRRAP